MRKTDWTVAWGTVNDLLNTVIACTLIMRQTWIPLADLVQSTLISDIAILSRFWLLTKLYIAEIQHVQQSAFVHPMFWRIRVETLPTQIISADGANVIVKASGKVYLPVQENPDARMAGMPQDVSIHLDTLLNIIRFSMVAYQLKPASLHTYNSLSVWKAT